jgi:hypothetical protein
MESMRRAGSCAAALAFYAIAGVVLTAGAASAFTATEAQCRLKAGTAYRAYGRSYAVRAGKCHRDRMSGKLPPAIDCDDPSTWVANGFVKGYDGLVAAEQRLRDGVNSCSPDIAVPASLGYTSCPAPCAAINIASFDDLGECLFCLTDDCLRGAVDTVFGVPPLPITKLPQKCQERVGRDLVIYFNKRSVTEQICELRKELGKHNYVGLDCTDFGNPLHPLAPRIQRATDKLDKLVAKRCAGVDLVADLDTCGTDIAAEQACLKNAVEQCTQSLFEAAYP